jgi:hypothetical protein
MDLFVVPTIGFDLLYAYIIVRLDPRELVWISVTTHPSAEWVARQITEAFLWNEAPRYMIRDLDRIYGAVLTRRLRAMVPMALHAKACSSNRTGRFPASGSRTRLHAFACSLSWARRICVGF